MDDTTTDIRRLIVRLAVGMMIADGRVCVGELDALEQLDALGLGPLSDLAGDEIRRAKRESIDMRPICELLASAAPEAAPVIVAVLADIAASDGEVSFPEIALLRSVAARLGVAPEELEHMIDAALVNHGAHIAAPVAAEPRPGAPDKLRPKVSPDSATLREVHASRPSLDPRVANACRVLGVSVGADRCQLEAAYAALLERYNPSKAMALGAEFAALAVRKLSEITAAFETAANAIAATEQPGQGQPTYH